MRDVTAVAMASPVSVEPALWDEVGNTPLLPLGEGLLAKAEWFNPGGSVKDRPAREILRQGLASGALPGRRLLDASSGNTAVAYAMLGAAAGVGVTLCVPGNASPARLRLLRVYGAEVIETDPLEGSDGAIRRVRAIAAADPDGYWYADQYNNAANPLAHFRTTGPEIWRATGGAITHLVAGVGTSGTMMGIGRFLRAKRPGIRVIAVQPERELHGLEGLKHMATAIVPGIYEPSFPDDTMFIATEAAEEKVRRLAQERGLLLGWSGAAAVVAAEQVLAQGKRKGRRNLVVAILPDSGNNYLHESHRLLGDS